MTEDAMELTEVELAENPDPRCPVVLLLDKSSSMTGAKIAALNAGLPIFAKETLADHLASRRVEVAVVAFDSGVTVVQNFVTIDHFEPPVLTAQGCTTMGAGIEKALDLLEARKAIYRAAGTIYYRPWILLITDGAPTDSVEQAAKRVHESEEMGKVCFFAVGVDGADFTRLAQIAVRAPLKLTGLKFSEFFLWLGRSMQAIAQSQVGQQVALPATTGWGTTGTP